MWTDEAKFELGERPGRKRVTRKAGDAYQPENLDLTYCSGCQSLMVWAGISHGCPGPIIWLLMEPEMTDEKGKKRGGGVTGARYVNQVLEGPMMAWIAKMKREIGQEILIVEDGAPPHTAIVAKNARARLGIKNLMHPPNSPDLNPIEPLWLVLKNRVADVPGSGNSLDNLWAAIQKVWGELSEEDVLKHTKQMQDRVEAVRKAKGLQTNF